MTVPPVLLTPRLRLAGHEMADFESLAAMWADPQVVRFVGGTVSTPQESWFRLLRSRGLWPVLGYGYWAVHERDSGRYVGDVGFGDLHRDTTPAIGGVPEMGWVLARWSHGRGYASEAVAAALGWMDGVHERTICILDPEHAASHRVAIKAGFVEAGMISHRDRPTRLMRRQRPANGSGS